MALVAQSFLPFLRLAIQYYLWRLFGILVLSVGVAIVLPPFTCFGTIFFFLEMLDTILHRFHIRCNIQQRYAQSRILSVFRDWVEDGYDAVVPPILTRTLQARVAMQGIVVHPESEHIILDNYTIQTHSQFFSRLPREIRGDIYRWLLVDKDGIRIEVAYRAGKPRLSPILHGTPFSFAATRPEVCGKCYGERHRWHCDAFSRIVLPVSSYGRGRLAMARTCKLAYTETIGLLYCQFPILVKHSF